MPASIYFSSPIRRRVPKYVRDVRLAEIHTLIEYSQKVGHCTCALSHTLTISPAFSAACVRDLMAFFVFVLLYFEATDSQCWADWQGINMCCDKCILNCNM